MSSPFRPHDREGTPAGLRHRIVAPNPPAPVPRPRPRIDDDRPAPTAGEQTPDIDRSSLSVEPDLTAPHASMTSPGDAVNLDQETAAETSRESTAVAVLEEEPEETSDDDVVRSTGSMAIATLLSRITGFIRQVLIGSMLGAAVGSAFQTANTLPNLITEIVLGSVLTALVVPVLVRAEKEDDDHGAKFIRRLFTVSLTILTVFTLLAVSTAPFLTRVMLSSHGQVNLGMSTAFAYLLLPQIFFYGLFSLFMAVLNTKGIFRPGAWAPVLNNVVCIIVLLLYRALPGQLSNADNVNIADLHVLLLGLGTTLGVVIQCMIMVPPLRRANIDLKPLWGIDDRLKQFGNMALAIIVYVAISQFGYIVTTRVAAISDGGAPLIYSQAWLLLQVPYGIIGVTLLTAIMPRLSRNAAEGDDSAVVNDLTMATKLTFIALIPIIAFLTALGPNISTALFEYGVFDPESANLLGLTLSFSAFTLIPYSLVMLHLRVFYAREEAWTPTFIIAGITATKVALSLLAPLVAASPASVVILLGAANGFGFVAGAVIGAFLLRRKLGSLGTPEVMKTTYWAIGSSLVGIAAALVARWVLLAALGPVFRIMGSIGSLVLVMIVGIIFLVVTGIVLSRSGLPEVQNLGRAVARIPGMSRFVRPDVDKAIATGTADVSDFSRQLMQHDAFNASPVPPPMSAGVVRGARLVPGAPVSDGRFRLIAEQGSVAGARFWQATEVATRKNVALTFVDTTGQAPMAARTPAESARIAAEVSRNTRKLAELANEAKHPGLAPNIRILSYRSGCLIVADWVKGSSLREVARAARASQGSDGDLTLNPRAVALALVPLAHAAADAAAQGTALGLDNASRLRVSTSGVAFLAFPAVLEGASPAQDASSLASAIEILTAATCEEGTEADAELAQIAFDARAVADETTDVAETAKLRDLADRLRDYALAGDKSAEADEEAAPTIGAAVTAAAETSQGDDTGSTRSVPTRSGFDSRGFRNTTVAGIAAAVAGFVILTAALTAYVTSVLAPHDSNSPVRGENATATTTSTGRHAASVYRPTHAWLWESAGQDPAVDHPETVGQLIDGDKNTAWTSGEYPNGLGTKPGVGVIVAVDRPVNLQLLRVMTQSTGARYTIYGIPQGADPAQVRDLKDLPRLGSGSFSTGRDTLPMDALPDGRKTANVTGVLLWISDLPQNKNSVSIQDISLIGTDS